MIAGLLWPLSCDGIDSSGSLGESTHDRRSLLATIVSEIAGSESRSPVTPGNRHETGLPVMDHQVSLPAIAFLCWPLSCDGIAGSESRSPVSAGHHRETGLPVLDRQVSYRSLLVFA